MLGSPLHWLAHRFVDRPLDSWISLNFSDRLYLCPGDDHLFDFSLDTLLLFFPLLPYNALNAVDSLLAPSDLAALLSPWTGFWTLWASRMWLMRIQS